MKKLTFNCTFLSDVILNASSATAGTIDVLDYIPGAKFLGIVAKRYYKDDLDSLNLFHNGTVRFGDAHMLCEGKRSLKIPLDFFEGKNRDEGGKIWIRSLLSPEEEERLKRVPIQLKQKRSGYFLPTENKELSTKELFTHSLKSAYDANKRRSKDEQMYAYTALKRGTVWQFNVELDDDRYEDLIKSALIGERSLGKSRSAQYGRVNISLVDNIESQYKSSGTSSENKIVLYAESNLCFLDEKGQFTLTPTPEQLGLPADANIDWSKSQIRHRIYAPWNGKRSTRDTDRWIIEKGSVLVVNCGANTAVNLEKGVGLFRAEGYGKVLVNPAFLMNETLKLEQSHNDENKTLLTIPNSLKDEAVAALLNFRKEKLDPTNIISRKVTEFIKFVKENKIKFDTISNSQWGQIRNIAQNSRTAKIVDLLLFNKDIGFCYTAKRKNEWRGLASTLKKEVDKLPETDKRTFLITLSSEMAKRKKSHKNEA